MESTTYEQVLDSGWPYGDTPTLVLTSRELEVPDGANVTFSGERTGDAIRAFAAETEKRICVIGGRKVVTAAMRSGVVDTLELYIMPIALGLGIPLFTEPCKGPPTLIESQAFANGVVKLIYTIGS